MNPQDPMSLLDADLTNVDTSMPLLQPAVMELRVISAKVEPNKAGTGHNLNLTLSTVNPQKSTQGDTVGAEWKVFHVISLTPTDNYPKASIERSLKAFRQSCLGDQPGAFGSPEQYIGNVLTAKVIVQEDSKGQYPPSNRINRFLPKE